MQKARDEQGNEVLSPLDKLYVVHVKLGKSKDRERWDAGGPLLPSLQVALASYPYTMIELEVRTWPGPRPAQDLVSPFCAL